MTDKNIGEKRSRLSKKEKDFCFAFVSSGDMARSAYDAGFCDNPRAEAFRLLSKQSINDEIVRLVNQRERLFSNMALCGYQRLAFGGVSDAVRLVCADNLSELSLEDMDLFLVSEIKKPKDGSMEIKFFDRLKAMEKLDSVRADLNDNMGIYEAINNSALSLGGDTNEN